MASLLPNGRQQFIDVNGHPLVGGKVSMFEVGTETPKPTWQDPAATILNTNPIILDQRGQALIWGTGSYRQILQDSLGNEIWDGEVDAPGTDTAITNLMTYVDQQNALQNSNLAAFGGSALIGFIQDGTGAVARTAQDKMRERVSVKDFGAKADCTNYGVGTDNLAFFNACVAYANTVGADVYIPAGRYRLSGNVVSDNSTNTGISDFRCSFVGDGPRGSQLWFDNGLFDGITINGTITPVGAAGSYQHVTNLSILKNDRQGNGLVLNGHSHVSIENLHINGWASGHLAQDVQESIYKNMIIEFCNFGAQWFKGTFTQPNAISLYNCSFGNNANYGLDVRDPSTFVFVGGSIESNGGIGAEATKWGCRIIIDDPLVEGTSNALFLGAYIENNVGVVAGVTGAADVWIVNNAADISATLIGCSFQRHAQFAQNCVRLESAGNFKNMLSLIGNGFRGFSDYTASVNRPYVGIGETNQPVQVTDLGNAYADPIERPNFSFPYITPQAISSAWCRFLGTAAGPTITPAASHNVASVAKVSTGVYTVAFNAPLSADNRAYSYMIANGVGLVTVTSEGPTAFTIESVNVAGVHTDFDISVTVMGGMNFV